MCCNLKTVSSMWVFHNVATMNSGVGFQGTCLCKGSGDGGT